MVNDAESNILFWMPRSDDSDLIRSIADLLSDIASNHPLLTESGEEEQSNG